MRTYLLKNALPIGCVLILVVAFPFFFLGGAVESSSSLMSAIWDCGHLIFFAALVVLISRRYDVNSWRVAVLITAVVVVSGGLIEIVQAKIGRDGNWEDLFRDLLGTWLGLFWIQRPSKRVWMGRVAILLLLAPNLVALFLESWYALRAKQEFPLLAGFESVVESWWGSDTIQLSSQYHTQGKSSLQVLLARKNYPGIKFSRFPQDWRGYKRVAFDIYNPDAAQFRMTVRINDVHHAQHQWAMDDRFNATFVLEPGWNHLGYSLAEVTRAPKGRLMDLAHISWIEIFATELPGSRVIYVDNFRLE